jgi:uncharacterized integral membrane protein
MDKQTPLLDERAVAVADRSYRLAWIVLAFGCLIDITVRGLVLKDAFCWDILGLVAVSSAVGTIYTLIKRVQVFSRRLLLAMVLISAIGGVIFAVAAVLLKRFWHS